MPDIVYLIRDTENPEGDLARGWSGNVGAWFSNRQQAIDYAERNGALSEPKQCPVSKMWCGDPELGLSAFAVTEDGVDSAVANIAVYVEWRDSPTLAVFASSDVDLGVGLDGEDVFRGGTFLGRVPYPFSWCDIQALAQSTTLKAPTP